jgi:membrane-associated phospholipid phosphatase
MLQFHQDWVAFLAEHRTPALTTFFQFFSFMGEIEGYLILIAFLYAAYDKRLAVQSTIVVLAAMIANHLIKIVLKNPRPFTEDGTYLQHWAVSVGNAQELAAEYSTPSGHAMAAAAIYGFLLLRIRHPFARAALISACILTGIARPIIGVHYVEDILLGWALGAAIAVAAHRYGDAAWEAWLRLPNRVRVACVVVFCSAVWFITLAVNSRSLVDQPIAWVSYLGFFAGATLAAPLEARSVGYAAGNVALGVRFTRFVLMLGMLIGALVGLDLAAAALAADTSLAGFALRFTRYALIASLGVFGAAWLFKRFRLTAAAA